MTSTKFKSSLTAVGILFSFPITVESQWALHSYGSGAVATSISYDISRNEIMVTGTAYANEFGIFPDGGPRCLLATVDNDRLGRYHRDRVRVSHRRALNIPQVCRQCVVLDDPGDAVLIGYHPTSAVGETLTAIDEVYVHVDYYGETLHPDPPLSIENQPAFNFPIKMIKQDQSDFAFLAIHQGDSLPTGMVQQKDDPLSFVLELEAKTLGGEDDLWTPKIQKLNALTGEIQWSTTIQINNKRTVLRGLAYSASNQELYVAGSRLTPVGFGSGNSGSFGNSSDLDWDGFVSRVDANTGLLFSEQNFSNSNGLSTLTILSQPGNDDHVHCIATDEAFLYIVGSTNGVIAGNRTGGAFLIKKDLATFETKWKRQIPGEGVTGTVCAVQKDVVYVGGTVPSGIQLESDHAYGGIDSYLAQFKVRDGTRVWLRQFGTVLDEQLVDMIVDKDGRPIVGGNSGKSSIGLNNVFYIQFLKSNGANKPVWVKPNTTTTPNPATNLDSYTSANPSSNGKKDKKQKLIISLSVAIPVTIAMIIIVAEYCPKKTRKEIAAPVDGLNDLEFAEDPQLQEEAKVV